MRVAVAGGTGVVGRHVVEALVRDGHEPVVLARSRGVDVVTGAGLPAALAGAHAVVDATNITTLRGARARAFFVGATRTLLAAEAEAGVAHHVVLSIVGVDRVRTGYYAAKLEQEDVALAGPVPATVVRATQFHEFGGQWLERTRGPLVPVPGMRIRPVAAAEAGTLLAEVATTPPAGGRIELAGPEVLDLAGVVRRTARARGDRRPVLDLWLPGAAARALRSGALLPQGDHRTGRRTFDEHLS